MEYALEIKNLSKSYKDFQLKDVSFNLSYGSILGLIGENGAGKSTTIRCILDMVTRDSGEIFILGKNNKEDIKNIKEEIGIVFDEVGIPEEMNIVQVNKIMKNIFSNWDQGKFENYLVQFNLPLNKKFKEFSKGMKMKLGIAIALSHNPKLLLLDEATSGLDPLIRAEVLDVFEEFVRDGKHAVLISSHIVSDLEKICDKIVFIHQGNLILDESKQFLIDNYKLILCNEEELKNINSDAIIGVRTTKWGTEAIVKNEFVPYNSRVKDLDIEELFLFMAKEG